MVWPAQKTSRRDWRSFTSPGQQREEVFRNYRNHTATEQKYKFVQNHPCFFRHASWFYFIMLRVLSSVLFGWFRINMGGNYRRRGRSLGFFLLYTFSTWQQEKITFCKDIFGHFLDLVLFWMCFCPCCSLYFMCGLDVSKLSLLNGRIRQF